MSFLLVPFRCGQGGWKPLSKQCRRLSDLCSASRLGICVKSSTSSSEVEGWVRMIRGICPMIATEGKEDWKGEINTFSCNTMSNVYLCRVLGFSGIAKMNWPQCEIISYVVYATEGLSLPTAIVCFPPWSEWFFFKASIWDKVLLNSLSKSHWN